MYIYAYIHIHLRVQAAETLADMTLKMAPRGGKRQPPLRNHDCHSTSILRAPKSDVCVCCATATCDC